MLALLPMKKNSERVPNKNIKLLGGKPLYEYVLDMLYRCDVFDFTVVNTDSDQISDMLKKKYNNFVKIVERPKYLRGNDVSMNRIIEHDLSIFGSHHEFFQTHTTNPLLTENTVHKALDVFQRGMRRDEIDSLFSVNVLQSRFYQTDLTPLNHNPESLIKTQDLRVLYEENSCFYIFTKDSFEKNKSRIGNFPGVYEMSRSSLESIEIDTKDDWDLVKMLINARES
jgi:CMP-N-acetylneuraminic acid synthetase